MSSFLPLDEVVSVFDGLVDDGIVERLIKAPPPARELVDLGQQKPIRRTKTDIGEIKRAIFDVVAAAALRCFFSKTLDGLGVLADARFGALEPDLRMALTVGRPIAGDVPAPGAGA